MIYPYLSNVNDYYFRIMRMWVKHKAISEAMRRIGSHGEPDVTKNTERQEAREFTKKDSRESRISTTGHNTY